MKTNALINKVPARYGWANVAKLMRKNNDDELLIADVFEDESFEQEQPMSSL